MTARRPATTEWLRLREVMKAKVASNDAEVLAEFVALHAEPGVDDSAIRAALRLLEEIDVNH